MWKNKTIIILASLLSACATPYENAVNFMPLNERIVDIRSTGNSSMSRRMIEEYALLAAADICLGGGFSHFSELASDTNTDTKRSLFPPNTTCHSMGEVLSCNTINYAATTYSIHTTVMRVYFHKRGEEMPPTAFNCRLIEARLGEKHKLKP